MPGRALPKSREKAVYPTRNTMIDKINEDGKDYVDLNAERAIPLGGIAHGTARQVAARSTLLEYPVVRSGHDHVEAVSNALATFGRQARAGIDRADQTGDLDTAGIFTKISRGVDKWLWFVEAHPKANQETGEVLFRRGCP